MRVELETANHGKDNGDNPNPAYLLPYELCCRSRNVGRQRIESCWRSTAAINSRSATSYFDADSLGLPKRMPEVQDAITAWIGAAKKAGNPVPTPLILARAEQALSGTGVT
jgi:hypothetical protein